MKMKLYHSLKLFLLRYRRPLIVLGHTGLIVLAYFLSFAIQFNGALSSDRLLVFREMLPLLVVTKIVVFYYTDVFRGLWRYLSLSDLSQILKANAAASLLFTGAGLLTHGMGDLPRTIFLIDFLCCTFLVAGVRLFTRLLKEKLRRGSHHKQKNILIIGAGEAGILMLKEFRNNPQLGRVVGFIDDDPVKYGGIIHGIKVLGGRKDVRSVVERHDVEEIVLAIPSAKGEMIRDIISYCQIPNVKVKTVPRLHKILSGDLVIKPRDVKPEDLLGRETVRINEQEVVSYIQGRTVLVTGAGGSIGSELCRQIGQFSPRKIILFDHNENDVYFLVIEFKTKYPNVKVKTVIGDIRDVGLLKQAFSRYRPEVVFHAAAHKHVPLMEDNPVAAVKNNILGSRNLIYAAHHYRVERFVLISTDKAVNAINVMGMSKRIAEMMLQAKANKSATKFIAVRFGNVIGSAGSVVPLFKKQIEEGGPITITHPEAQRYFMSVKEAALLVLQAAFIGKGGEIFILDMGEQIKILDIAKDLVTLSGYTLHKDIGVEFTGLRPGEKLSEELLLDKEKDRVTKHNKIYISPSQDFDSALIRTHIRELKALAQAMDDELIVKKMQDLISHPFRESLSAFPRSSAHSRSNVVAQLDLA